MFYQGRHIDRKSGSLLFARSDSAAADRNADCRKRPPSTSILVVISGFRSAADNEKSTGEWTDAGVVLTTSGRDVIDRCISRTTISGLPTDDDEAAVGSVLGALFSIDFRPTKSTGS